MEFYLHFNLTMARSPGFGSCTTYFMRPFQTRSRYGCGPEVLNLARDTHSPDHSTKGTRSHVDVLSVLVNTRFQVLFHSPPGVLFTFPSRYYSLSVILLAPLIFRLQDYHLLWYAFPHISTRLKDTRCSPNPEEITSLGLASSAFARHYLRNLG